MNLRILALALTPAVVVVEPALAQDQGAFERLDLRVNTLRPGRSVVVDRGRSDLIQQGDKVLFYPRDGRTFEGTVIEVQDRTAVVELLDPRVSLLAGTRGEVFVPKERFVEPDPEPERQPEPGTEPAPVVPVDPQAPEHPPWQEDEWEGDMPLLAQVQAVRPEERAVRVTGRTYLSFDATMSTTESDRSDSFTRLGGELLYENPFGRGGGLHLDGELNYRTTGLPDHGDEEEGRLRADRISYYEGGTRFDQMRWEAGRFLQYGMPEFGVLDGYEINRRLDSGDVFGASAGMMPELDPDFETGQDVQIAAFYHHVIDEGTLFTVDGGYQKTWHDGAPDRDLLIAKVGYAPLEGWNVNGTAWIDVYGSGDDVKDAVELTQAYLTATRRWRSGNGWNVTYDHQEFPSLDRNEVGAPTLDELEDAHNDRLSLGGWRWSGNDNRFHGRLGAWVDEEDSGGDVEVGMDVHDALVEDGIMAFSLFGGEGRFSSLFGARVGFSRASRNGSWNFAYEMSQHELQGFTNDLDEIVQHRILLGKEYYTESGWSVSINAEGLLDDDEDYVSLGVYIQRSF